MTSQRWFNVNAPVTSWGVATKQCIASHKLQTVKKKKLFNPYEVGTCQVKMKLEESTPSNPL